MTENTHIWLYTIDNLDPDTIQQAINLTHALTQQLRPRAPRRELGLVTDDWTRFARYTGRNSTAPRPDTTGVWHPSSPAAIYLAPRVTHQGTTTRPTRAQLIDALAQQLAHHLTANRHHDQQWRSSYAILLPLTAHLFRIELSTQSHLLTMMRRYQTDVTDLGSELDRLRQEARTAKRNYSHLITVS